MKKTTFLLAGLALAICIAAPILFFTGVVEAAHYKACFGVATVLYFGAATYWSVAGAREKA